MLHIDNVSIAYGDQPAVTSFSLSLSLGEIGCLLGPSGCSKTTLLRAVAGFLPLKAGRITIDGELASDECQVTPPELRNVGMVFQDFALFPHLTIRDNVMFGIRQWPTQKRLERVSRLLSLIGMAELADRYPHELSGGQQQRVALIRALAPKPKIVLMDEPFSNIDVELREMLYMEVSKLLRQEQVTALLVTHDQDEAFMLADKVAVMKEGQLQQWDTGYNVYHKPINRFVAQFIGAGVFIEGTLLENGLVQTALGALKASYLEFCKVGERVNVLVRPDDIIHNEVSPFKAKIVNRIFRGATYLYTLELSSGERVLSMVNSHHCHQIGEALGITLDIAHCLIFVDPPSQ